MQVKQIYEIVNSVTEEITGKSDLVNEDLSNIVDVGEEIFNTTDVDNYVKTLVNRIGKVVFVARPYSGKVPSVLMDSWDFGAVVQKISADLPEAIENRSWELEDGADYSPNIFYKPTVSNKFFNNKVTFEIDMSFTERQVKESFTSASEVNSFISMLYNAVDTSFTVKVDGLIMRTINSMIGETLNNDSEGIKAVNLLTMYNEKTGSSLQANVAMLDKEFIRFASMQMGLYIDRLGRISTLFNVGGKERFTSSERLHIVMLSDFKASANSYLQSDTFHNEFTALPNSETVPYWQGSGKNYDFDSVSSVDVVTGSGSTVKQSGILAVMFDTESLGVTNYDKRVTTNYNPKGEFYTNFYKMDCGAFNDLNENFVVFYIADSDFSPAKASAKTTKAKA